MPRTGIAVCLAVAALAATGNAAAEERLLVQQSDLIVVVDREVPCGEPVPITVRARDRGVFDTDGGRMQSVADGVRAILGFECARIPELRITGETDDTVRFRGVAGDATHWLVETRESLPETAPGTGASAPAAPALGDYRIAGLTTGMPLDQAMTITSAEFGAPPRFHEDERIMRAVEGGCDFDFDDGTAPRAGWRCLEAAAATEPTQPLYAIGLVQAVDRDQRESVTETLTARYGPAARVVRGRVDGRPYTFLAWGDPLDRTRPIPIAGVDLPLHPLEAHMEVRDGLTIVSLRATDPAFAADGRPVHRVRF